MFLKISVSNLSHERGEEQILRSLQSNNNNNNEREREAERGEETESEDLLQCGRKRGRESECEEERVRESECE